MLFVQLNEQPDWLRAVDATTANRGDAGSSNDAVAALTLGLEEFLISFVDETGRRQRPAAVGGGYADADREDKWLAFVAEGMLLDHHADALGNDGGSF